MEIDPDNINVPDNIDVPNGIQAIVNSFETVGQKCFKYNPVMEELFFNDESLSSKPSIVGFVLWKSLRNYHNMSISTDIVNFIDSNSKFTIDDRTSIINHVPVDSDDRRTSLHFAVQGSLLVGSSKSLQMVTLLLKNGANVWQLDHQQQLPFHKALHFLSSFINFFPRWSVERKENFYRLVRLLLVKMTDNNKPNRVIVDRFIQFNIVPKIIELNNLKLVQILDQFNLKFNLIVTQLHWAYALQQYIRRGVQVSNCPVLAYFRDKYRELVRPHKLGTSISIIEQENYYRYTKQYYPQLNWDVFHDETVAKINKLKAQYDNHGK